MSLTPSSMLPLGTVASDFSLTDVVSGKMMSLDYLSGKEATLIMFICNHCPYVKHIRKELVNLHNEYQSKGVSMIAISSNDAEHYPEDSPAMMKEEARNHGYKFPYLYDHTQQTAKDYQATCTPDFFLFDTNLSLVYRGRLDESTPGNNKPLNGADLRNAINNLLDEKPVSQLQHPSIGCNIKWKN